MERQIKFRGKDIETGQWVYGSLICGKDLDGNLFYQIENADMNEYRQWMVDGNTVGQYTGLKDKDEKRIFEGDIVETDGSMSFSNHGSGPGSKREIYVLPTGYCGVRIRNVFDKESASSAHVWNNYQLWNIQRSLTIIGNIHDNPEILKNKP